MRSSLAGRPARLDVLGGIELLERLPDDLRGLVARDRLGARVPARHDALRVEHDDHVVLDAFQQQPEAFLAVAQLLLVAAALREVARDLGVAHVHAIAVAQRRDHDVGPETRAVLPHAPAFVLEASQALGGLQLVLRPAAVDRALRIEDREVLADDLVGLVALQELRAAVPRLDAPIRVEEEDGVVGNGLDQPAKRL
ncbi:MAG TPA: hypothetical protein VLJ84_05355, partial [Usitatibacter sp.]|nr:hypothetical protein [Usitatibacter sp.]